MEARIYIRDFMIFVLAVGFCGKVARADQLIEGTVVDSSGAVIPGAAITLTNGATGIQTILRTDAAGLYRSPSLPLGEYAIQVSKPGFQTLVRTGVTLDLGAILRVDFTLRVGITTQRVAVSGAAPILNTENPSISGTLQSQAVALLPLRDRLLGDLMETLPGVYYTGSDNVSYGTPRYSLGGTGNNLVSINGGGMALQQGRTGNNQWDITPPVESVQEVQIDESSYGAQYGGHEGGLIRVETKSGTNQFHGSAYEYFRNQALDTRAFFAAKKQPDNYNLFGGSLGGPIKKDKMFFFVNVEGTVASLPESGLFTIPTTAERNGDFSGLAMPIYNPMTNHPNPGNPAQTLRDPFSGNIIPTNLIDPVAAKVASYYPDAHTPGPNNFPANWSTTQSRSAWTMRLDDHLGSKDTITGTWLYDWVALSQTGLQGFKNPAAIPTSQEVTQTYRSQAVVVSEMHTFSATAVGTFHFDYMRDPWQYVTPSYNPSAHWAETLGLKNIYADWGFPNYSMSGYYPIGGGASAYPNGQNDTDYIADFNLMRGRNSIKFGDETTLSTDTRYGISSPAGNAQFDPRLTAQPGVANTGDGFASFMLGAASSGQLSVAAPVDLREQYTGAYIEDTIQANRKLTLDLGLRYEIDTPMYEAKGNRLNNMDLNQINPVSGTPGILTFAGINGYPTRFENIDWTRFYPRIGFAYELGKDTVIRGGYGIYGSNPKEKYINVGFDPVEASFSTVDNGLTPAFYLANGLPAWTRGGNTANLTAGFGAVPVGQTPTTSPAFQERDHPWPYAQNFDLSIQRQLPHQIEVEADGIGALARHLNVEVQRNQVPENLWGTLGNAQVLRSFPQYGAVEQQGSPEGISDYYGLDLKASRHFSNGLLFLSTFTWQKIIEDPGFGGYEYNGIHSLSRGLGGYSNDGMPSDQPLKQFNFTWVYQLPFGSGKRYMNSGLASALLGGWAVSGIWTWYGGIPFGLQSPVDSLNCFCGAGSRLDQIGTLAGGPHTIQQWFNTNAVREPAFGQLGTMGVTPPGLISPDARNLDAAISKAVTFRERYSAMINLEIFNLTNTTKFGFPGTTYGVPGFGVISSYTGVSGFGSPPWYGARIMQLGVHFAW
jgi:hypothetical protein